ncbi:MAG: TadE/TadG family type IV pilus assembly protein [bacterium]
MKQESYAYMRGSVALEFALILPIFSALLFGVIEFGSLMYNKAIITNAAREGARFGITSTDYTAINIEDKVKELYDGKLIVFKGSSELGVTASIPSDPEFQDPLTVTVQYTHDFLVLPDLGFLSGKITVSSECSMLYE